MGAGRVWVTLVLLAVAAGPLGAQTPSGEPVPETVNLFFDCQGGGCGDLDFFRREIPYVNWVRDREVSDVHVLVTSQSTGGGGRQYQLDFIGRGRFDGLGQQLLVSTAGDATDDEVRRALAGRLGLGLGPFLAGTPQADRLSVVAQGTPPGGAGPGRPGGPGASAPEDDPWDFWVFTIRGNANLNGESSYNSSNLSTSVSANRTTDAWKLNFSGRFGRSRQNFEIDDTTTVQYTRDDWSAGGLVVKSVTERFSLGMRLGAGRSTYLNEDFRWSVSPGVELNAFPYSESSRRSLTFQALLEARHWDYAALTIFGETDETRLAGTLRGELEFVQPWGRASLSADHSRYFHDSSKWQSSIGGFFEVRLFKGFSVNMFGSYGWVRDQLYIAAEGYSQEEILLRQRALATDFNYFTSFGISYRFGSIFNNVVNPRFGGGDGGRMMVFF